MLRFVTGSANKFQEIQSVIPEIEQIEIDLPEIQDIDPHVIIEAKLKAALEHTEGEGEMIVEDTSVYLDCLNGFPGPFIKWFFGSMGNEGLADLVAKYKNDAATVKTIIGYTNSVGDIHFFEGVVRGRIVSVKEVVGVPAFQWDKIFIPEGETHRYSEMGQERKREISMRSLAAQKLKIFLSEQQTT
jgi:non-canonical purine NTP pyrophosphatase (RdgB/HAM1 family)